MEVRGISIEVVRKDIKNLHVGVYPPNGRVRVAAPLGLDDESVRLAVISRLSWINRHRAEFERQVRETQRELVTGESHHYLGRRYRLDVVEASGSSSVQLHNNTTMRLRVPRGANREARDTVLQRWYRSRLREQIPPLLARWQLNLGVSVSEVRIKRMKTYWGSCNADARRIWLNLELVKKSASCLEYMLLHEMVHLLERHHNDRFVTLMDGLMPRWRLRRKALNRAPLGHEAWKHCVGERSLNL